MRIHIILSALKKLFFLTFFEFRVFELRFGEEGGGGEAMGIRSGGRCPEKGWEPLFYRKEHSTA